MADWMDGWMAVRLADDKAELMVDKKVDPMEEMTVERWVPVRATMTGVTRAERKVLLTDESMALMTAHWREIRKVGERASTTVRGLVALKVGKWVGTMGDVLAALMAESMVGKKVDQKDVQMVALTVAG